ncbi:MAG: hypothetical protein Q4B64_10950 [Spirochaetales bacterium]|nr:hypothetical protein [Spirochaetales bacterium]
MSLVTVGNNRVGNKYYYGGEDFILEAVCIGYSYTLEKASSSASLTIYYYFRWPTSGYYEETYGDGYYIYPLVFSNNNGFEYLNAKSIELECSDRISNGWKSFTIPLKRKLQKGETVTVGWYGNCICPIWDNTGINKGTLFQKGFGNDELYECDYEDWDELFNDGVPPEFFNTGDAVPGNYSLYWTYDAVDAQKYSRSIKNTCRITHSLFRKQKLKRKASAEEKAALIIRRSNRMFRLMSCETEIDDRKESHEIFGRYLHEQFEIESLRSQKTDYYRFYTEEVSMTDLFRQLLILLVRIKNTFCTVDLMSKRTDSRRMIETTPDCNSWNMRKADYHRKNSDSVMALFAHNAGRLFKRAVKSMCVFWEWLKGKIRDENCVVELFTPITVDIYIGPFDKLRDPKD